jgi:hypothetical protein
MNFENFDDIDISFFQMLNDFFTGINGEVDFEGKVKLFIKKQLYQEEVECDEVELERIFLETAEGTVHYNSGLTWDVTIYVRWGHP